MDTAVLIKAWLLMTCSCLTYPAAARAARRCGLSLTVPSMDRQADKILAATSAIFWVWMLAK